jgi:hypothetical protein
MPQAIWGALKFLKVAESAIAMVLGSVQDQLTFSTVSFMKNRLRNQLTTNLELAVAFKLQNFFTLGDFSYDATYESWRDKTKRQSDANSR